MRSNTLYSGNVSLRGVVGAIALTMAGAGMVHSVFATEAPVVVAKAKTKASRPAPKTAVPATVQRTGAEEAPVTTVTELDVTIGKSHLINLSSPIARLSVGDPKVADVLVLSPKQLYVLGKTLGSTNVMLWDKLGRTTALIDVNVSREMGAFSSEVKKLVKQADVRVRSMGESLVLEGHVPDAMTASKVSDLADAFVGKKVVNMLTVDGVQQVMLEVKVAEINRTLAEKLGFDFTRQFTTADGAWTKVISGIFGGGAGKFNQNYNATQKIGPTDITLNGFLNSPVTMPLASSTVTVPAGSPASIAMNGQALQPTTTNMGTQDFTSWLIDAQKKDGLVKILAEPNIVAISGQEGSFLAGGEIMIPVPQAQGTVTLESKQFGVGVRFTPIVLEGGRIHMRVLPEVTDLVGFTTVATSGLGTAVLVPTLTTRRVSTTVELREGQSLAIGGLLQDGLREQINRFPVLGEIPILGALFRSSEFQKNKTELLIVVTPRLIKPLAPDYKLPTDGLKEPTRSEFLFGGQLEGKAETEKTAPDAPAAPAADGHQLK